MASDWNIRDLLSLFRSGQGTYGRLVHKNALNPITYLNSLCVFAWPAALGFAIWGGPDLRPLVWILVCAPLLPLGVSCWAAVYFAVRKPDALRSESYLLQQQKLTIEQQGAQPRIIDLEAEQVIENPGAPALHRPEGR